MPDKTAWGQRHGDQRVAPIGAVEWEELPWEPRRSTMPMSRSQRASIRPTYHAAIPAEIAGAAVEIEPEVAAEADDARAEIARFDAELSTMFPDSEVAPLSSVLLRTESASSSQIENITAGARSLALAELGFAKHESNAELVAANVAAMTKALEPADGVDSAFILAIHEALMEGQEHARPGEFRAEQVWIGGHAASPHAASFVPPLHDRVATAIDDLSAFTRRTDVPLLTQSAIAHAQFETIHPFNDGNGRTGRAIVHVMLKHGGATTRTTVPVSSGLLADTDSYFQALTAYREGNPNPIVTRFASASLAAVGNGRVLARDLGETHERWQGALKARRDAAARRALPHLLSQPAITSSILQEKLNVSQPAADKALKQLKDAGIVRPARGIQRYVVWVADDVIRALDDFGVRARRQRV